MNTPANPPCILVVDDTPANLHLLDELLRQQGYQVRLFPRGALALKAAAANPPDLILLDIKMPEMDGFAVCRQLKANPALRDIPVIFISALTDTENKVKAFAEGGLDYVTKPFEDNEVLARVRTHLVLYGLQQAQARQQAELAQLVDERTADLLRAQRVAHIGSWKLDLCTQALSWSPETYRLFGVPDGTPLTVDDFLAKVHPDDRGMVASQWALALQGQPYDVEYCVVPPGAAAWVRERAEFGWDADGQPHTAWGTTQDISEVKNHQAQVDFITHHDVLTGLSNRADFLDLLRLYMAHCTTLQTKLVVAYIDIDGFAAINSLLGREQGDALIVALSRRLAQAVRDPQSLARIGGDEFAVVLSGLKHSDDFLVPVQRILQAVAQPLGINGHNLRITASIGVSMFPQSEQVEAEQLLRQADQAMYLAKLAGKNRHQMFDPLKHESIRERYMRIEEVRLGLLQGDMRLYYQPKVWLASGEVAGFEALIRWQHPLRGLVPPGQFIPLLEQHPLVIQLGDWVIETALAQLAAWNASGLTTSVSVNIESLQLQDPDFVPRLARQLAQFPSVRAPQLELEILESGTLNDMAQVSTLIAQLHEMGVTCALDDFGTGYSSLTFLKQLGAQTIKIDQSFVSGMRDDTEHFAIVNSVLELARGFNRHTLAEGVETEQLGQMLIELGCELAQGYAIARPMPAEKVPEWLLAWHPFVSWQTAQPLEGSDVQLLLAEVEHRAWMKALKAHLAGKQDTPPLGSDACPFGGWLNKASTRRRFGLLDDFEALIRHHDALHALGTELITLADAQRHPNQPASAWSLSLDDNADMQTAWYHLTAKSAEFMASMRSLRQCGSKSLSVFPVH